MGDLFRTCQDGHRCENGSLCAEDPEHEASFYCDCSTATGDFAGLFCEYEAQNYCRFPQEVTSSWFCTNDGTCKVSVNADKSQWNCDCSEEYEGPHCEFINGALPSDWPGINQAPSYKETNVNLIASAASLLSGKLDECLTPDDESCEGGIASVMAYARNYTRGEPTCIIQKFDKNSPFVNMHPLEWVINRLILREIFGLDFFMSNLSLLLQNKGDSMVSNRDISDLQTHEMPFLVSNTEVSPSNSWHAYVRPIHFDKKTGLAVVSIADSDVPLWVDQSEATKGILNYIAKVNKENGCASVTSNYQQYLIDNPLSEAFIPVSESEPFLNQTGGNSPNETEVPCWVSVIFYSDVEVNYWPFLNEVTTHENPPDLIVNLEHAYETFLDPEQYQSTSVWVANCPMDDANYCQHRITLSDDKQPRILNVDFINDDLEALPAEFKDGVWNSTIRQLRKLADEAQDNNPVVGYSGFMPVSRSGTYRACQAGECPLGSLFTEAIRWFTNSDVAFTSSGGYRGEGFPAGPVKLTDLYGGLPFPNTECSGTMSGLSLFKLLNYTTSISTFEGEDSSDGGRLMQVSGMKVAYNTLIQGSRLVSVDVWDSETESYQPLDRLKLYRFATDSYVCAAYDPYPAFTGGAFSLEGEVPGVIGESLVQNIAADYLGQLDEPFDTSNQGRLRNETTFFEVLNFIQDEDSCPPNTVWNQASLTCFQCPSFEFVVFSDEILHFEADNEIEVINTGRVVLVNREPSGVSVLLKSKPRWVTFTSATLNLGAVNGVDSTPIPLESGENLVLQFDVFTSSLGTGRDRTALGTVSFGVEDGGKYPGCTGLDATFDLDLRVTPPDEPNHLGSIFYVGVAFVGIVFFTVLFCVSWVYYNRNSRVVKVMQPLFLFTICFGVFILSSVIIPMGIDDGIASDRGCDIACMSMPWLMSTGFTLSFSALFSKLWRINRLFNATPGIRRIVVRSQDVLAPFCILFAVNFCLLLGWTIVDPLTWERYTVEGEDWNTYGSCSGGTLSLVMIGLIGIANFGALLMACSQAYLARNISDEFSESKYIGIAIYGWFQILIVGVPILFLIDYDNPTARYFLQVVLVFIVSMSMLLIIFLPAFVNFKKQKRNPRQRVSVTGVQQSSHDYTGKASLQSQLQPTGGARKNVALAIMDSIDERSQESAPAEHVSGGKEIALLDSQSRNRKRLIEQQQQMSGDSMAENVDQMMLAMEEDSSSDDSSKSSVSSHMEIGENSS